ncbi:hypothetical protein ACLOJK_014932 [Asimina triloba]
MVADPPCSRLIDSGSSPMENPKLRDHDSKIGGHPNNSRWMWAARIPSSITAGASPSHTKRQQANPSQKRQHHLHFKSKILATCNRAGVHE